jgi:Cof subfamily protein (haloacid dehalogenase superfamily)
MHQATQKFADQVGLPLHIISYNGAVIRTGQGATLRHLSADPADTDPIVEFCAGHGYHLNFYCDDRLLVGTIGRWARFYLDQTGSPMEEIGDIRFCLGRSPTKLILIDAPDTVDSLVDLMRRDYGQRLYITKTNPEYLEFMPLEANKGTALETLAGSLGIDRSETMAIGDGLNDLPMLEWAGVSVAMAGSAPEVLSAAGEIAPSAADDGVAVILDWLSAPI